MYGAIHSPRPLTETGVLIALARAFTPRVEVVDPALVLLDLHGLGRTWTSPEALGRAILDAARERGIEAGVALASTCIAARMLARARKGLTVITAGGETAALAPLPLALLDLDPERAELFRSWGLRTLGDLARLPPVGLAERFGCDGPHLRRSARGEDDGVLVPAPLPESFEMTLDLEWPVDGLEPLSFLLARVLEPLCESLGARGRKAAGLVIELRLVDGSLHRRALKAASPSVQPRTWRTLLLLDLEAHPPHDAIGKITIRAEPTLARTVQFSLLDPAQPCPERLAEMMARLHEWTAAGRAGSASLLDSHRPGAFVLGTFAPGPAACSPSPSPCRVALRAFRPPLPAYVTLEGGAPVFVAAPGVRGVVIDCAGPWRASGDWWDVAWSREEWDVALATGGVYRIFRDRLREAWIVEGELD